MILTKSFVVVLHKAWNPADRTKRLNWMEARDYCKSFKTELVSIHNAQEDAFIAQIPWYV